MKSALVHESQTPKALEAELAASLEHGFVPPKFLYTSPRQSELWLELHQQCAPTDDLGAPYLEAAPHLPKKIRSLVSLGCGGGEKEVSILDALKRDIEFIPTDVSEPLARTAAQLAEKNNISTGTPLIFDLATANNAAQFLHPHARQPRLLTFFGIIPNFPPTLILPKVRSLMENNDYLLASANLAPNGMEAILEQYDNPPTRRWLEQFLTEYEISGGILRINIHRQGHVEWFQADYMFEADTPVSIGGRLIQFASGDALQLFVSHRYTPDSATKVFAEHGLRISQTFLSKNREEGVFLCLPQ